MELAVPIEVGERGPPAVRPVLTVVDLGDRSATAWEHAGAVPSEHGATKPGRDATGLTTDVEWDAVGTVHHRHR
jgi:chitodextrinase